MEEDLGEIQRERKKLYFMSSGYLHTKAGLKTIIWNWPSGLVVSALPLQERPEVIHSSNVVLHT